MAVSSTTVDRADASSRVICVGEVMIELARGADGRFAMSCRGDTFNTAIYLARAGVGVGYATALGDDAYSDGMVALAAAESIDTSLMLRAPGRLPGLCLIDAGSADRSLSDSLSVWADDSPARETFERSDWNQVAEALVAARLIYFSGVTLSLYSNVGLGRFLAVLEMARSRGAKVAFDGNFRPRAWRGDLARARAVGMEALKRTDIALPAFDDEAVLWGDPSPEATVERLQAFGVADIVVKNGPNSALVASGGTTDFCPVPEIVEPVDASAAGDGFNAGYLAARLTGATPLAAAAAAHRVAAHVIRHRGAIVPRSGAAMH